MHPQKDTAIISLDAKKAFGNVNLKRVFKVLHRAGFRGNALSFLERMYASPIGRIYTLGALSAPIRIKKGTRQGCHLLSNLI